MSVERQLSQWGRGQRVAQSHKAQGAGPKAPRDVDDLEAAGRVAGEAWRGRGVGGWVGDTGRRTTTRPAAAGTHRGQGSGTELAGMRELSPRWARGLQRQKLGPQSSHSPCTPRP